MYTKFSTKLKEKYSSKVYKIPISIDTTCPVRDGSISKGGCIFCGEKGAGYENGDCKESITKQINDNLDIFVNKYKAEKFILYFQNFTNTYIKLSTFKNNIIEAVNAVDNAVAISISTRPDCIDGDYLDFLKEVENKYHLDIIIELGLQSVNNETLKKLNRGHTLADYLKAALLIKSYDFEICTHIIASIPYDRDEDLVEAAKILSILNTNSVKIHSLYIEKNTILGKMYEEGKIEMLELDDFVRRVVLFLENLSENIAVERLVSRVPKEEDVLFLNWDRSHWVIQDMIIDEMKKQNTYQGKKYKAYEKGLLDKFK
ncbi:TIGR01212 family radical SAM protein [Anaerofustis stercorihominis]|uniref:TIGR01212 family radical SAM protein n=1 Tax=Anaerofustis stercorihominis TaxID=214853 RepID=UPI0021095E2A|nr:TIGR01212 family radical SAM protein [Anaerofustis stercorihominis]MCQ4794738.1 TIGR01212 family radical SAM protein [Anaerofustis stercorihominis]